MIEKDIRKLLDLVEEKSTETKQQLNESQGVAEGLDPDKRSKLDDLIDKYRNSVDPSYDSYGTDDHYDSDDIISQIRSEFGDKIADQVEAGAEKMHFGRPGHKHGYDPLGWRTPIDRQTKAGKMFKQDSDYRKNMVKSRYKLSGKSATESVAEGSEWETRHDEFTTVGDRATPEQINKIVSALSVAAKQASSKRGFLNQIVGKQSNDDLARMAHGAETLAKNIQRNSNTRPGTDERKELGQHLVYAVSLLKRMSGEQDVAEGGMPASVIKNKQALANMSPEEFAQKYADKSDEELMAMAWRHGYGKGSKYYVDKRNKDKQGVAEAADMMEERGDSPVARSLIHRIMMQHPQLLSTYGPEMVMAAIDDVADSVGEVEEIGGSDIKGWVGQVVDTLSSMNRTNDPHDMDDPAPMESIAEIQQPVRESKSLIAQGINNILKR